MTRLYFLLTITLLSSNAYTQNAVRILEHNNQITIKRADILCSDFRETNISVTPDGKYIFFMTDRGGQKWSNALSLHYKKPGYDGDLYFSKKVDFSWSKPKPLNPPINTSSGEDEPVITPDGQFVYFQSWGGIWQDSLKKGPYYKASLNGENWEGIQGLGDSITYFFKKKFIKNRMAATDGMSVSPDEKTILIAYGDEYEDEMDLYITKTDQNGKWSMPRKLSVSTPGDERSVFIAADGKTIYFASNGYGGFGGLDIFKTTIDENGRHGEVINIGKPFNTEKDDYGFIVTASGNKAYFIREGDIYFADLIEADYDLKPLATKVISGKLSATGGIPVSARVSLVNLLTGNTVDQSVSNSYSGEFSLVSPQTNGDFDLKIITANKSETITKMKFVNEGVYEKFDVEYVFNTEGSMLTSFSTKITVYFDYDKSELKETAKNSINARLSSYRQNNITSIIINGFTDGDGSMEYNQKLGLRRAKAVAAYMTTMNLNTDKIQSFGKLRPVAPNNSDEGKSINRRVEITINYSF